MVEINIYNEDCFVGMDKLGDKSIDMILCDLPYEVTKNSWDSLIFYKSLPKYNPQFKSGRLNHNKKSKKQTNNNYGKFTNQDNSIELGDSKYPGSILSFAKDHSSICVHPTQKPIALLSYLIKTYSNENDLILDNCMGVGSTLVACMETGRNGIGFENIKEYYELALKRISKANNKKLGEYF